MGRLYEANYNYLKADGRGKHKVMPCSLQAQHIHDNFSSCIGIDKTPNKRKKSIHKVIQLPCIGKYDPSIFSYKKNVDFLELSKKYPELSSVFITLDNIQFYSEYSKMFKWETICFSQKDDTAFVNLVFSCSVENEDAVSNMIDFWLNN